MDLRSDNAVGVAGISLDAAIGAAKSLQQKAILKQAKKLANAGQYDKLTGRMIDIMIEAGVDPSMYNKSKVWLARPENQKLAQSPLPANTPIVEPTGVDPKKIIIYIVIAALVMIVFYFIANKNK